MTLDEYIKDYKRTALEINNANRLVNAALGLSGEAGEFANLVQKRLYQGHTHNRDDLILELGDILWFAIEASEALEVSIPEVLTLNVQKRKKRYPEGFSKENSINREV